MRAGFNRRGQRLKGQSIQGTLDKSAELHLLAKRQRAGNMTPY
jgi:hypothetical protein